MTFPSPSDVGKSMGLETLIKNKSTDEALPEVND